MLSLYFLLAVLSGLSLIVGGQQPALPARQVLRLSSGRGRFNYIILLFLTDTFASSALPKLKVTFVKQAR